MYGPALMQLFFRYNATRKLTRVSFVIAHAFIAFSHSYLSIATVSLFVVNLVPAPILDGADIFRTAIELLEKRADSENGHDLEAYASSTPRARGAVGWASWAPTAVAWASTGMLLCAGLLSLVQ
jgi:hypothetical protein